MIIALSYDGIQLNVNEKSGALRAVFPDQIMNAWAKKLQLIEFSTEILATPQANRLYFFETLGNACNGQYTITEEVEGGNTAEFTYYGKSIAELIEAGILTAISTDKMIFPPGIITPKRRNIPHTPLDKIRDLQRRIFA
jgi:hypothetical protein